MAFRFRHLIGQAMGKRKLLRSNITTSFRGHSSLVSKGGNGSGRPHVMTPENIAAHRRNSILEKIEAELKTSDEINVECPYEFDERFDSHDCDVLKSLLKDFRKFNLDNKHNRTLQIEDRFCVDEKIEIERKRRMEENTIDMAHRIIKKYGKQQNMKLEFVRVVDVVPDPHPLKRHVVVEACDLDAARTLIKLKAFYSWYSKKVYRVEVIQPVPFMRVNRKDKKAKTCMEPLDSWPLLFANLSNCPVIAKRLGSKAVNSEVNSLVSRGNVIKLSTDDDTLLSLAVFAVKHQNENERIHLQFVRVTGAWLERISKDTFVYHIMLEAWEALTKRVFYTSVMTNGRNLARSCIDWVAVDAHKATMALPC